MVDPLHAFTQQVLFIFVFLLKKPN